MDAGVPIKKPVGGIAVGLIATDDFSEYQLLVDMAEGEDFYGKMDFKVTGTYDGINAIQMDNKMGSIPVKILQEALDSAEKGRFYVLDNMNKIIDAPRTDLSETAPRFKNMKISKDKIGELIGPGGKNIKEITEVTGAQVDIEDDGTVNIFADNSQDMAKAVEMVSNIVEELEVGETYKAEVTGTSKIGVFVKVRGKKGLVHISEIKDAYVEDPSTEVDEGEEVKVKLVGKDNRGRLQFSMKQA
jgi:polyribonucleotide nucleotidyltransferase